MTLTLDEEAQAEAYKADLHARCTYYKLTTRFKECHWENSGYCGNCGRERPVLGKRGRRMTRRAVETSPVLRRLRELAAEFDEAAAHYAKLSGHRNDLMCGEAGRAAAQLRMVAQLMQDGTYTQVQGVLWIRAGWRIINAIGRKNLT